MKFSKGFTLIEVIITIVIMAIAAAAFLAFFGTAFMNSGIPAGQVFSQYKLIKQMETITSQYRNQITSNPTSFNLTTFQSTYVNGQQYVDSTNTGLITLTSSDASYTTANVLRVTLTDGKQTVMSIFTQ
jgi:prepilin-type N-terminal cleavage/methylation domain-containing protein